MKVLHLLSLIFLMGVLSACTQEKSEVTISPAELMDKIKGGWAGQAIGVCYGLPTESRI